MCLSNMCQREVEPLLCCLNYYEEIHLITETACIQTLMALVPSDLFGW
jgi:hypothetical protein